MSLEACVNELLVRGTDDWVDASEVAWVAKAVGGAQSQDAIRDLSIHLIREIVGGGLMEVGDVTEAARGFRRWDLPREESLARVEREWRALNRRVNLGDVCWLSNTPEGDRRGSELVAGGYRIAES